MGASESVDSHNAEVIDGRERKSKQISAIVLLFGLFAPFLLMISSYGFDSQIMLLSLIWSFISSPSVFPSSSPSYRFEILPLEVIIQLFPLVLLRLVPVLQIYRYYEGKATRRRALIASIFGDGVYIFYIPFMLIIAYAFGLHIVMFTIPLPFQFLFCVIVLWRYPIPKPTTPWDKLEKQKSWWEKDQTQKKESEDEDELW